MDAPKDGEYSRAPELQDLIALCKNLDRVGAKYLLIGGFAVILHGFVRGTKDIDLLVDESEDNIKKIKQALSSLPDKAVLQMKDNEVHEYTVVRIADEIVIDLMAEACGIGYREASKDMEYLEVEGVKIPVATKELLIRLKDTMRPSDQMDVAFLRKLLQEEKQ